MYGNHVVMSSEGAVAAANVGGVEAAATSTSSTSLTTVVAVSAAIMNLLFLIIIGVVCVRRVRRKRAAKNNPDKTSTKQGQSNGAFRADAGTLRSFHSLSSKFTPTETDVDSISTSSSLSTIS